MKKFLIIANTYFQFIVASHMTLTIFNSFEVDIILTDQTKGLLRVYERIEKDKSPFKNVYWLNTKKFNEKKAFFITDLINSFFLNHRFDFLSNKVYDELLFFNLDLSILSIIDVLRKNNTTITISRYEEGVLSYNHEFNYFRMRFIILLRKIIGKSSVTSADGKFYCMYPVLYKGTLKPINIPMLSSNIIVMKQYLKKCFDISIKKEDYKQKYIFFSSVYDFEGEAPIKEYEAVCKIAEIIGKENLLIKQHPRDNRTIYNDNGFVVDKNSKYPWEVIQFAVNLNDKTLLSVNSTSILSSALLFGNVDRAYYVFELCDLSNNSLAKESILTIKELLNCQEMIFVNNSVKILKDVKELNN